MKASKEKRHAIRKSIYPIHLERISLGENQIKLCRSGTLIEVSETGFKIMIERDDIIPLHLRSTLDLSELLEERIILHLDEMDLEVEGYVKRTQFIGKGFFEIGIDYSDSAPDYWRQCLVDLLPQPNEIED